ncbi:hypothetical protein C8R46DRAFT_1285671 [Mycena filopes]|nr:hypothetical protein C8R46DRAFT_1285671 [Mycena filopes]
MRPTPTHLVLSAVLTCVAAIPNDGIRYAALGLSMACALMHCYLVHRDLHSPAIKLHRLAELIEDTTIRIRSATAHCQRHHLFFVEQTLCLLQADHTASLIRCRIIYANAERFSWKIYRLILKDIETCIERVESIGIAIDHIIESERQRQLADEIHEVKTILSTVPTAPRTYLPNQYMTERTVYKVNLQA